MSTMADYRAHIRARGYDGSTDDVLDPIIQDARNELLIKRRWTYALAQDASLLTTIGNPAFELSNISNLGAIEGVRYRVGTTEYELVYLEPNTFRSEQAMDATTARGTPVYWTRIGDQILLTPTPDAANRLVVDYVRTYTPLPEGQEDFIPDTDRELVCWFAILSLAARQREAWLMEYADRRAAGLLRSAIDRDQKQQRQTSDQVQPYWRGSRRGVRGY
jgi:hypothetical protein